MCVNEIDIQKIIWWYSFWRSDAADFDESLLTLVEFEEQDYLDRCDDDEEYDTLMTKFYKDIEVVDIRHAKKSRTRKTTI